MKNKKNKKLGMKWFAFYTKVRPWLACLAAVTLVSDFVQYKEVYMNYWWLMAYFFVSIAQVILCVMVFAKASGDHKKLIRFIKGVLVYETFSTPLILAVREYVESGFAFGNALLEFAVTYAFSFLVWYRLNIKYFEKRYAVLTEANIDTATENYHLQDAENLIEPITEPNEITFCQSCGEKFVEKARFCKKCGTKIDREKEETAHVDVQSPMKMPSIQAQEKPKLSKTKNQKNKKLGMYFAIIPIVLVITALVVAFVLIPAWKYNHAMSLLEKGEFELAYSAFEKLNGYSNSEELLLECRYAQAVKYRYAGDYEVANGIFRELGNYRDSKLLIHEHDYSVVSREEATCTTAGSETLECSGCKDSYIKYLKASHQYVETKATEATCTSAGSRQFECSLCHNTYSKAIAQKSHQYSSATCTQPKMCMSCGKTEGTALGHLGDGTKCAICGTVTFETLSYSGVGSNVIDCTLPNGKFKITATMSSGEGSIDVKVHYTDEYGDTYKMLSIFDAGNSEVEYINGATPCTVVVNASDGYFGNSGWKVTIEAVES